MEKGKNFLANLPKITQKRKKRLGRGLGSGKGAKSGRGTTRHQKARGKIPLGFEGGQARMIKRFPLLRGKGKNKPLKMKPVIIDFDYLNHFKDGETIDRQSLIKKGLTILEDKLQSVKILANGKLERKLTIKISASKSAKKVIEKLGGKIET